MTLAPPCLSIRVPGAHSRTQSTPGAFGISTYSHRMPNSSRPRRPSETSLASVSSSAPSAALPKRVMLADPLDSPVEETLATGELHTATSDWQGDSDSEHEHAHIALARLSAAPAPLATHNTSSVSLGLEPPTPDIASTVPSASVKQVRRTASIYSVSSAALDLPSSPIGTFISTIDASAALRNPTTRPRGPSRQCSRSDSLRIGNPSLFRSTSMLAVCAGGDEKKRKRGGLLPAYQRHANDLVDVRTVLGEGPGGREEKDSDRLKRLYLCPWDALSPKSFRSRFSNSQPSHNLDLEKQPLPSTASPRTRAQTARLRLLSTLGIALLIILLLIDLLLINYRTFHPSRTLSSAQAQSLTCTSLFALTAPSDPLTFPCTTCFSSITSSTTPSSRTPEQAQVVQFCALKDVYEARSLNSTLGTSDGWMVTTDVCSYGGVQCDTKGRVQQLSLVDPNVPSEVPSSLRELKGELNLLQLNGVDYTGECVN